MKNKMFGSHRCSLAQSVIHGSKNMIIKCVHCAETMVIVITTSETVIHGGAQQITTDRFEAVAVIGLLFVILCGIWLRS